ncbi:MAG: xanthine dehydrogenase family protein subunit M [Acidimicrobiia bacterium]|nr:xanthine dehydrogenase family protein subunit M [Acidimicrobiia bacterium]NNF63996.1 xanthine dehydrogenase family protein subunit M [Acidimicrobiia bacterium]
MHKAKFDYHRPESVDAALALLQQGGKALAGGHSLIPVMKMRLAQPDALIDLGRIPDLSGITDEGDSLRIGATTTHTEVNQSDLVQASVPVLCQTAGMIGDPQVRNRGTIGGSIAHADPAADYPTVLVALGATVHIQGPNGSRDVGAADFFVDLFQTALGETELITAVTVPKLAGGAKASYQKHRHPASAYAVVGVCAVRSDSGQTVVIGGASATPTKVTGPMGTDEEVMSSVAAAITDPMGDTYASGEYRVHLAGVLARRAIAATA